MTGKELKALRESAGIVQDDLARMLEVRPRAVAKWESYGDKPIREINAIAIRAKLKERGK